MKTKNSFPAAYIYIFFFLILPADLSDTAVKHKMANVL